MSKPEVKKETITTIQNEYTVEKLKKLSNHFEESIDATIERCIKALYYKLWKELNKWLKKKTRQLELR